MEGQGRAPSIRLEDPSPQQQVQESVVALSEKSGEASAYLIKTFHMNKPFQMLVEAIGYSGWGAMLTVVKLLNSVIRGVDLDEAEASASNAALWQFAVPILPSLPSSLRLSTFSSFLHDPSFASFLPFSTFPPELVFLNLPLFLPSLLLDHDTISHHRGSSTLNPPTPGQGPACGKGRKRARGELPKEPSHAGVRASGGPFF
jgi:hypothetical protein